jgi:hypothetical protein
VVDYITVFAVRLAASPSIIQPNVEMPKSFFWLFEQIIKKNLRLSELLAL